MPDLKQPERKEIEQLSAYLDGMLTAREMRELETLLSERETLRRTLAGLRVTKTALRTLAPVQLTRNFTLTPEMVGPSARRMPVSVFRTATAFAALAFVVSLGFDMLSNMAMGGMAPLMEAAPAAVQEMEAPMMLEDSTDAAAADSFNAIAEERAAAPEPFEEETLGGGVEAPLVGESADLESAQEVVEAEGMGVTGDEPTPSIAPAPTMAMDVEPDKEPPLEEGVRTEISPRMEPVPPQVNGLRLIEYISGGLALVFAVLTQWFRRRK
ncbi:MAG: hypothetical protein JXA97_13145 [Anaerolineales bacterium]|nr:hypothetical protein [Anaerolineales bacterium]